MSAATKPAEEEEEDDDFGDDWEDNIDKIADNMGKKSNAKDLPGLEDDGFSSDEPEEEKKEEVAEEPK